uniref:VWFA domain-containing protein n=1 Tax=Strigamia maritima TaxID=126957 RepID=T1J293_STRMM
MKWTSLFLSILLYNFSAADEIAPLVQYFKDLIQNLGYQNLTDELDKLTKDDNSINGSDIIQKLANAVKTKFNSTKQALHKLKNAIENNERFMRMNHDDPFNSQEFFGCCDMDSRNHNHHTEARPHLFYNLDLVVVLNYSGCHLYNSGTATTTLSDNAKAFYKEAFEVMKEYLDNKKPQISSNFFYATVDGAFYLYPARKLESCVTFDPRKRSWYAESSTLHAKDVVIAVDVSGSMEMINIQGQSLLDIVKIGATTVINTLNVNDRVGVVAFSSDVVIPADFECYKRELAVATPQNKQCINKFINSLRGKDLTNYVAGLERAFFYFNNSPPTDEHRDRILLFLSDGMPTVGGEWENISKIIDKNCVNHDITLLTYGIGKALQDEQNRKLLTTMAARCPGEKGNHDFLTEITSPNDMQNSIANYYLDLHMYKDRKEPIFTLPYLDAGGLGLILSMCLPVQKKGKFIGVACTDIQIADLLDDVINFHQGKMSYSFLINQYGQTYFHPLLPMPSSLNENAGPVDIDALERDPAIRDVIASMKNGESGKRELETQRTISHGSTQTEGIEVIWAKTIYVWAPVSGYNFSVCVVIAADEQAVSFPDQTVNKFIYHNFRKQEIFNQQYFQSGICKRNEKIVYTRHSGIKFAPAVYKNPIEYRKFNETSMNITEIIHFMKNMTHESVALEGNVRAAVAFTDSIESIWKTKHPESFIWKYIATFDGVFRLFPAAKLNKVFDPRKCQWFQRALNNKGITILTSPYLDNLGSGYIVSVGKAVCKKECQRYDIQNPVTAVVGGDLSIHFLHNQLSQLIPACQNKNRCILVDHSAYIVMHDDFVFPKSGMPLPIQYVHLSVKEPNITRTLLNDGILRIKACLDILSIKNKYYWQLRWTETRRYQDFVLYPVFGTNVYLIVKTKDEDLHKPYSCNEVKNFITEMAPSRSFQEGHISCTAAWEYGEICNCSCSSPANFDPCPNTFDYRQLSDLWPTCVPGTQHIDMSDIKDKAIAQYPKCEVECNVQANSSDCYKMEGCMWCLINKDGGKIEKPICAQNSYCYYGIIGHKGPYGEQPIQLSVETQANDSSLAITLSVTAVIIILAIVFAILFVMYRRKKIYLTKKKDDKSQLLGCTLRTSIIDMERDNPSMVWGNLVDKSSTTSSQAKEQIYLRKINHPHSSSSDSIAYLAQKVEALVHKLDSTQASPYPDFSFRPAYCSSRHSRGCNRPSSIPSEFSTLPRSTSFTSALSSRSSTLESINSGNYMPASVSSTLPRSTLHLAPFPEEQILDPISLLSNQVSIPTERTCNSCACRQPSERTWPPFNSSTVDVRNPHYLPRREPSERSYHGDNKSEWQELKRPSTCSVCRSSSLPSYGRRSNVNSTGLLRNVNAVIRRRKRTSQIQSNRSSSSSSQMAAAAINSLIQQSLQAVANEQDTTTNENTEENDPVTKDENCKTE